MNDMRADSYEEFYNTYKDEVKEIAESIDSTLSGESDRGVVLILSTMLDEALHKLLENYLIDDYKNVHALIGDEKTFVAPLGSFHSRILAAYGLGLISKTVFNNLNLIRKIRNEFAHKIQDCTFNSPRVIQRIEQIEHGEFNIKELGYEGRFIGAAGNMYAMILTCSKYVRRTDIHRMYILN